MKRNFVLVLGALVATAATAQAQRAQCSGGTTPQQNACNMSADLFTYMAPQLGAVIAGGNTTLGQGGSLGGLPHFAITVRGNALWGSLPKIDQYTPSVTSTAATTMETADQVLGLPSVDAAIGVFGGLPLGVTKVGGIDLLLNAAYIPEYSGNGITVKAPDGSLKIGYGARLGLLQESLIVPGIGFSYVQRDLPKVDLTAASGTNSFNVTGLEVKTTSWRLTASKSLIMFGLAAGVGQDKYESSASIQGTVGGLGSAAFSGSQEVTRTNYFANVSMNMLIAKLVAEIGQVSGGDEDELSTYNTFQGKAADASRLYGSVGLRIGF